MGRFFFLVKEDFLGPEEALNTSCAELPPSFILPCGWTVASSMSTRPAAVSWTDQRFCLSSAVSGGVEETAELYSTPGCEVLLNQLSEELLHGL